MRHHSKILASTSNSELQCTTRLWDPILQALQFTRAVAYSVSDKSTRLCNIYYPVSRNKLCILRIVLTVLHKDTDYGATCGELLEVTVEDTPYTYVVAKVASCHEISHTAKLGWFAQC
jgi:hypothetical protein